MLSNISIKNLGCFDDHQYSVNFNKLNVLVGQNNSGKSMLLNGLNILRYYSITDELSWNNEYYSLQNNQEAVYGHDTDKTIETIVKYQSNSHSYESRLSIKDNLISYDEFLYDNTAVGQLNQPTHQELVSQIWYFRPVRSLIPFRSDIGEISGGLQPISPSGQNITQFLLELFNDRDPKYDEIESWLKKIDPQITLLKTPIIAKYTSIVTDRNDGSISTEVNVSLQGSGINNVATIIAAILASPPNTTIIIEEPENSLHSRSIEILVDLFNFAVNDLSKQIIIVTHSWDILRNYISDIGAGTPRGSDHVKANSSDFKLIEFTEKLGTDKIKEYDLTGKKFSEVTSHFKVLWG